MKYYQSTFTHKEHNMSEAIPNNMTPDQLAMAENNKAALKDANRITDYSNSAIKACVGACQLNDDTTSPKALAVAEASNIHNTMVEQFHAVAADSTITTDMQLLMQDDIINKSAEEFQGVLSNVKGQLEAEKAKMQGQLYTANLSIDPITMGLMPTLLPELIKDPFEFMGLETMASAVAVLNARGLYPNSTGKRGEPKKEINDSINRRYSPDAYKRIEAINEDMARIVEAEKKEQSLIRKMRPDQRKISRIRNNKFKG